VSLFSCTVWHPSVFCRWEQMSKATATHALQLDYVSPLNKSNDNQNPSTLPAFYDLPDLTNTDHNTTSTGSASQVKIPSEAEEFPGLP